MTHLIVFTRYPVPSTTKTRLIPALGPDGAANLQRQMTEHTLAQVQHWQQQQLNAVVDIRFSGGDRAQMVEWLGDWRFTPQGEGSLGDRLGRAMSESFAAGAIGVLAIGIDCPGLTADVLMQASRALEQQDVVLGPSTDGGYYLIGLNRRAANYTSDLFGEIAWSTEVVLAQTLAIAQRHNLSIATLAPLSDVDYPDDLPVWENRDRIQRPTLSVIIPTLNEAAALPNTLKSAHAEQTEILVSDGGSTDETLDIARSWGAIALMAPAGRAQQQNHAARIAQGEILLFLHADTQLPPEFAAEVRRCLAQPNAIAGAFELAIDGENWPLRWVEWGVKWRSRLFQRPYGDQALFLPTQQFWELGGFAEMPIMEDLELVQRLNRLGGIAIARPPVLTSGRRWKQLGVWQTTLLNQIMLIGYGLGVSPHRLARWYRDRRVIQSRRQIRNDDPSE
jgi:uncharacterized protein